MPSTASLIQRLKTDYPQFTFAPSADFLWSPTDHTVYFNKTSDSPAFLLHELSHGLLDHTDYQRDVELIAMERAAWDRAVALAGTYDLSIEDDLIETTLDSYRDWLHARSTCPECQATGLQTKKRIYSCPACGHNWRVNEARICALRRFSI